MTTKPKRIQWKELSEGECQREFALLVYRWMCRYGKIIKNKDATTATSLSASYAAKVYSLYYQLQLQAKSYPRYHTYHSDTVNACFYSGIIHHMTTNPGSKVVMANHPELKGWMNQLPAAFSMHATYRF